MRYNGRMKIVVFDADEACREEFTELSGHEIVFVEQPATEQTLREHADAEIVSVFVSSVLPKPSIDGLLDLKCIIARSTGVDHIDVVHAASRGILVCNVPRYGSHTVAEFTFALILTLSRRIFAAAFQVREEGNFKTEKLEGFDLFGKTIGIIGTGAIGRNVAKIAAGFGMSVLLHDTYPDHSLENENANYVELPELLAKSDIISLHVPYTAESRHLLDAKAFTMMKQGALVINTARGELVDSDALLEALKSGKVAGAGLDVLEGERGLKDEMELVRGSESIQDLKALLRNHMLIDMPQVVITPHIAFFSKEAYREILATSVANVQAFAAGTPQNIVRP